MIIDFEGEPARPAGRAPRSSARRCATSPGCCAPSPTPTAATRDGRRRGTDELRGPRARDAYLSAYLGIVHPVLLPDGDAAVTALLSLFELEKVVYELRYELDNRPDWLAIPVAGIRRLLEPAENDRRHRRARGVARREHGHPHAILGAHPADDGVIVRTFRPGGREGLGQARQGQVGQPRADPPRRHLRGRDPGRERCRCATSSRSITASRQLHARGSLPLHPDARRARPAPDRRGAPRGGLRQARRSRAHPRGRGRAPRSRSGPPRRAR